MVQFRAANHRRLCPKSIAAAQPQDRLTFVKHRGKHKSDTQFDIAIEDDLEQAILFKNDGVTVYLMAHPWNVGGINSGIERLNDWPTMVDTILGGFQESPGS